MVFRARKNAHRSVRENQVTDRKQLNPSQNGIEKGLRFPNLDIGTLKSLATSQHSRSIVLGAPSRPGF
jgi:hypothetical protein